MPQKIHCVFATRGCRMNRLSCPGSGCGTRTLQETPPYLTVRRFKRAGSRTSRVQLGGTRCEGVAVQTSQISIVLCSGKTGRRQVANQIEGLGGRGTWKSRRSIVERSEFESRSDSTTVRFESRMRLGHGHNTLPFGARSLVPQLGVGLTRRRRLFLGNVFTSRIGLHRMTPCV